MFVQVNVSNLFYNLNTGGLLAYLFLLYLYGTCKCSLYISSNFLSRVKLTTVLIFSMASVAICNRNTNVLIKR